jgi:hypothetical protein
LFLETELQICAVLLGKNQSGLLSEMEKVRVERVKDIFLP